MATEKEKNWTEIRLCAVWEYDQFPGFLVGEATKLYRDGKVYVPSYQNRFQPVMLLPLDQFNHLQKQTKRIQSIKDERIKKVVLDMEDLRKDAFPKELLRLLDA